MVSRSDKNAMASLIFLCVRSLIQISGMALVTFCIKLIELIVPGSQDPEAGLSGTLLCVS